MSHKIFVLEGCDNTGKTTLAQRIIKKYNAHYIHCSWSQDIENYSMVEYLNKKFLEALDKAVYQPVVLDRHIFSTVIYENIYREGILNKQELRSYCEKVLDVMRQSKTIIPIVCTLPQKEWEENFKKSEKEEMYEFSDQMIAIYQRYERLINENFLEGFGQISLNLNKHDFINEPFQI